jgi:Ca2+-binding EF-hand superfamily protein
MPGGHGHGHGPGHPHPHPHSHPAPAAETSMKSTNSGGSNDSNTIATTKGGPRPPNKPGKPAHAPAPVVAIAEEEEENDNNISNSKSVSFLPPNTLRWLNRRRPAEEGAAKVMSASRALQLRNVFTSLDFEGNGEIGLGELKEAIFFVARPRDDGAAPLIEDPDKICKFFESMDVDGNGAVDFNEFLFGMTSGEEDDTKMRKVQQAFFEFANMHNRQMILESVADESVSDLDKFEKMKTLFSIKFLQEEEGIKSVEDQIKHAQTLARKEMKEMHSANSKSRNIEMARARRAAIHFQHEQSNKRCDPMSVEVAIRKSKISDVYMATKRVEHKIERHLSHFPIEARINTYQSVLEKTDAQVQFGALLESQRIKGGLTEQSLMLPPLSIRKQIHNNAVQNMNV